MMHMAKTERQQLCC